MIEVKNISKKYSIANRDFFALQNINLQILDSEFVSIVGKSGSGKTTLLNVIGTLDNFSDGQIFIDEVDISKLNNDQLAKFRSENIGYIFQNFYLEPEYTVYENIELPLILLGKFGKSNREIINKIAKALDLTDKLQCRVKVLSGGEQQRVAIARAIIKEPKIILADEPCGNLDSANSKKIMEILTKLHLDGKTVILVTHDDNDAKNAGRIITLSDGMVISDEKNILAN